MEPSLPGLSRQPADVLCAYTHTYTLRIPYCLRRCDRCQLVGQLINEAIMSIHANVSLSLNMYLNMHHGTPPRGYDFAGEHG